MADNGARKSARVNTVSGRTTASSPTKPSMTPASRGSARGGTPSARGVAPSGRGVSPSGRGGDDRRKSVRPPKTGVPKEFIAAAVIIAILGIGTAVVYSVQTGKKNSIESKIRRQNETHDHNVKLTFDTFQNAFNAGYKWIQGSAKDLKDDDLFGPMKSDVVYNVIYTRNFKDKKGKDQTEEKVMYPGRTKVKKFKQSDRKDNVDMTRGQTDDDAKTDIYVANKIIPAEAGDNVNQGGSILVIVKTDKEGENQ